jgi:hypothetical protein
MLRGNKPGDNLDRGSVSFLHTYFSALGDTGSWLQLLCSATAAQSQQGQHVQQVTGAMFVKQVWADWAPGSQSLSSPDLEVSRGGKGGGKVLEQAELSVLQGLCWLPG